MTLLTTLQQPRTVADLQDTPHQLVTDSFEIETILDGLADPDEFGCLFVLVESGEYAEIFGCSSIVPALDRPVSRIL